MYCPLTANVKVSRRDLFYRWKESFSELEETMSSIKEMSTLQGVVVRNLYNCWYDMRSLLKKISFKCEPSIGTTKSQHTYQLKIIFNNEFKPEDLASKVKFTLVRGERVFSSNYSFGPSKAKIGWGKILVLNYYTPQFEGNIN